MLKGLFLAFTACILLAVIGLRIVETDEAYWWYGPEARMNWLGGGLGGLGVALLIGLPI